MVPFVQLFSHNLRRIRLSLLPHRRYRYLPKNSNRTSTREFQPRRNCRWCLPRPGSFAAKPVLRWHSASQGPGRPLPSAPLQAGRTRTPRRSGYPQPLPSARECCGYRPIRWASPRPCQQRRGRVLSPTERFTWVSTNIVMCLKETLREKLLVCARTITWCSRLKSL